MEQVPAATALTDEADIVQTEVELEVKVTDNPLDAE